MFLENDFMLMNKDEKILEFSLQPYEFGVKVEEGEQYSGIRPYGFTNMKEWLENRRAPKHREHIEKLLAECGCNTLDGYIRVSHALTLTDTFWVKEAGSNLRWKDVSLYENDFNDLIAHIAFEGGLYGKNFSTTSPEFGTDGTFAKCWTRYGKDIYLLKRGSTGARNAGLEPYSEYYSSQIAKHIASSSVEYDLVKYHGKIASRCLLFTSQKEGFVPAGNIFARRADPGDLLKFYGKYGGDEAFRRMIILDALILNTDRHMGNHGVIVDNDTMEIKRMAPVFDNNMALLPCAEKEEFDNLDEYLALKGPAIGEDFNLVAHAMLTPEIRSDLINLKGFTFDRSGKINLPDERLDALSHVVDKQIEWILGARSLYMYQKEANRNQNKD